MRKNSTGLLATSVKKLQVYLPPGTSRFDRMVMLYNDILRLSYRIHNRKIVKCNICGWEGNRFLAFTGHTYAWYNVRCPGCYSMPRHRGLAEYLRNAGIVKKESRCLEIGATSKAFKICLEENGCQYYSVDLTSNVATVKMDTQELGFSDSIFDLIICSHVLEHVSDDKEAIKEMHRILKPTGQCIVIVPIARKRLTTIEYDAPNPREHGHVRSYGRDIVNRFNTSGFHVEWIHPAFTKDKVRSMALKEVDSGFFICKKD